MYASCDTMTKALSCRAIDYNKTKNVYIYVYIYRINN